MNKLVSGFKKVVGPAISIATEMSVKTIGILVDKYTDPTVPEAPQLLIGIPETIEQALEYVSKDPSNAQTHYLLARMHQERFELTAARIEFELSQLLSPLEGEQKFYYLLLLFHMGIIDRIHDHLSLSEIDESLLKAYPEIIFDNDV
jgi:hypothetical protein